METNSFSSILVFLVGSYLGLIINILVFCISIILLIIKRKTLKMPCKIIFTTLAIISISFIGISIYFSIAFGRYHSIAAIGGSDGPTAIVINESNQIPRPEGRGMLFSRGGCTQGFNAFLTALKGGVLNPFGTNKNNGLELFYNDYEIVNYNEHLIETKENNGNTTQINFTLRIINFEKLNILKNSNEPIIYVHINNKKYLAKGQLSVLSSFPNECDLMFSLDNNGKIEFIEDKIISFLGFENKIE